MERIVIPFYNSDILIDSKLNLTMKGNI